MAQRKAANRWKPDSEAPRCNNCQSKFSLFLRRHHCRQCGDIYCDDCSHKKRIVPIVHATEPQRVCDKCFQISRTPGLGSSPAVLAPNRVTSSLSAASGSQHGEGRAGSGPNVMGRAGRPASNSLVGHDSRQGSVTGTPGSSGQHLAPPNGSASVAVSSVVLPPPTYVNSSRSGGTSPTMHQGSRASNDGPATTLLAQVPRDVNAGAEMAHQHQQQPGFTAATSAVQPPLPSYLNPSQRSEREEQLSNNHSLAGQSPQSGQSGQSGQQTNSNNSQLQHIPGLEPGMCIIPPDDMYSSSEDGDYGDDDGDDLGDNLTGTPPSMRPTLISSKSAQLDTSPNCNPAGGALSFMAALEDATRVRQLSLPVLLYVQEGHELPIVANVESADEVVEDIIVRLAPRYWELKYGLRRRPKGNDLEEMIEALQVVNESGMVIPRDIPLSDLCRRQERVVLATTDTVTHHQKATGSTRSLNIHSAGFFMRSERSEESGDDGAILE